MNKQKTRPPKTLKCSKSKTIKHRKLKSSHHIDLIYLIFVHPFYFNYGPLAQKFIYALFLSQNMTLHTFLLSGKFFTQKCAHRKVFIFSASVVQCTVCMLCKSIFTF